MDARTKNAGELVPLGTVAKWIADTRPGGRPNALTLARWIQRGVLGKDGQRHRLEAVRVRGQWKVSRESFQRFLVHLQASSAEPPKVARNETRNTMVN